MAATSEAPTSCCPATALGYLASDTACKGSKVDLGEGVEFYQTGETSSVAILLFPDGKLRRLKRWW